MIRSHNTLWLAVTVAVAVGVASPFAIAAGSKQADSTLAKALADPNRGGQRNADLRRHPFELIRFSGLRPGQRVLDLIPGDGYWTRIFSKIVGPTGKVYAVWPQAYAKLAQGNVDQLLAISRSPIYPNVSVQVQRTTELTAPEPLDMVWTSQNYHDYADPFMGRPGPAALSRAAFRLLKPGGIFMVIDHSSAPGRGMADTDTLHRIDPQTVRAQAKAAGFEFVGESRVLINSADPLTVKVFDASVRGRTSQFALKFRKPLR